MNSLFSPEPPYNFTIPILGIIPLLMVTDTFEKGMAIGVINLVVIVLSSMMVSVIRNLLPLETRLTAILLINATIVSLVLLLTQLWFFEYSQNLGIYIPLIAVNCLVLVWAEEYALSNGLISSGVRTFTAGTGILIILVVIACIREYSGLIILKQPAGVFLLLGLLTAVYSLAGAGKEHIRPL